MNTFTDFAPPDLRTEIAAVAARMIAEDGADYQSAKRKAVQQVLGNGKPSSNCMPDNAEIEDQVRLYNELFLADTQPARLQHLRQLACLLMADLAAFQPYLTGAVLNGTAGEHSDIHLQLFIDSTKDVEIELLNRHIDFTATEPPTKKNHAPIEILSFMWRNEGVHLSLHDAADLHTTPKNKEGRLQRANLRNVQTLLTGEDDVPK
jgi:hypothetical protein